jgi:hypothetical protein
MGKFFALAVACLMLLSENAAAGWYRVVNYAGFLGADPIHFSLQTYDGFGSGITAEGSYFYDARQSPIALYGKAVGEKLELCEIADDKALDRIIRVGSKKPVDTAGCPFSLALSDDGATGTWIRGATSYPVALKKVASLDDSGEGKIEGTVEIPFWAQTSTHRLSGTYAKTGSGVCMEKLQIIDKGGRKVVQELAFDKENCNAGMLMTPIYLNVEKQTRNGADVISVSFRDSGAGYATDYIFNRATRRFAQKK